MHFYLIIMNGEKIIMYELCAHESPDKIQYYIHVLFNFIYRLTINLLFIRQRAHQFKVNDLFLPLNSYKFVLSASPFLQEFFILC